MTALPILYMREWSTLTPESPGAGAVLRGIRLTAEDRAFIATLEQRSSLRFVELRDGLSISVGPHIGTVSLSSFRVVVMPKLRIDNLMRMVAYAFDLSDIAVSESLTSYRRSNAGLVDLLGLSLLREVERIARSGLLPNYEARHEDLATPRGRLDLRHAATHPRTATLRCTYHDLTVDHRLHQILAEGLRVAANVMDSSDVRLALARAADRFFGDITRLPLDAETIRAALEALDRRSSHYRAALTLVELIAHGARLGDHMKRGAVPLSSFTLNMNLVFERFLGRYLVEHAPAGLRVSAQDVRSDVFRYVDNASRWRQPTIRPDFVIRGRTGVVAVAGCEIQEPPRSPTILRRALSAHHLRACVCDAPTARRLTSSPRLHPRAGAGNHARFCANVRRPARPNSTCRRPHRRYYRKNHRELVAPRTCPKHRRVTIAPLSASPLPHSP